MSLKTLFMTLDSDGITKESYQIIREAVKNKFGIDAAIILDNDVEVSDNSYFFNDTNMARSCWRRIKNLNMEVLERE